MLRRTSEIKGYTLGALDGEIGRAKDFYFDDRTWTVRYLVADTGKWLELSRVLLSPHAVRAFDDEKKLVHVDLTKDRIKNSPSADEHMPVSRQFETEYYQYYNYPVYWDGSGLWGPMPRPGGSYSQVTAPIPTAAPTDRSAPAQNSVDANLRSVQEVAGYHIQASDGEIGHVEDFIIDDEDWSIRYVVVDTVNWWPGKKVLVSPHWAKEVDWHRSKLHLDLDRETIKSAPEFDLSQPISRAYEERLLEYYHQKPNWVGRQAA